MANVTRFPADAKSAPVVTALGQGSFPNPLFDQGRDVLARFGFRRPQPSDLFEDWAEMWSLLKGDFTLGGDALVPDYDDLPMDVQKGARDYMDLRLLADRRLMACEKAHREMLGEGINGDLVELYTSAREAYEDTVNDFGVARTGLEARLRTLLGGEA